MISQYETTITDHLVIFHAENAPTIIPGTPKIAHPIVARIPAIPALIFMILV